MKSIKYMLVLVLPGIIVLAILADEGYLAALYS